MNEQEMEMKLKEFQKELISARALNAQYEQSIAELRAASITAPVTPEKDKELQAALEYTAILEQNKKDLLTRIQTGEQQLQNLTTQNEALKMLCIGALDRLLQATSPKVTEMPPQQPQP